jgi:hypothetical protein
VLGGFVEVQSVENKTSADFFLVISCAFCGPGLGENCP